MESPSMDKPKNPHAVALGRLGGLSSRRSKLTEADVHAIRASKDKHANLAVRFGVTVITIYNIQARRTWKWLKEAQ